MKRRRFLRDFSVILTALRARLASPFVLIAGASISGRARGNSAGGSEAAEADWIARSTGSGVLWAHDFREDSEFHNFHKGAATPYERVRTAPEPMPYHATLVPTPFGASRAIRSAARGTHLTRDVPAATEGEIQVWHVAEVRNIAEPWAGEYKLNVQAKEYVWVQSRNVPDGTITVRRTRKYSYTAGKTTIGSGPQGRWIRPTASFPAGQNGKSTPDQGLKSGAARKPRSWQPRDPSMHFKFREGYFGHRSYWDPAVGSAQYKDWTPQTETHNEIRPDAWEGDEFYLQFRARISASRLDSPHAKMIYIQNCTSSGNGQLFWGIGKKSGYTDVPANWSYGLHGNFFKAVTCWGDGRAKLGSEITIPQGIGATTFGRVWADGEEQIGWQQDPGSFPDARYKSRRYTAEKVVGWHFPVDKWVTYLVHMKPGRNSVIQYCNSTLAAPAADLVYSEKNTETLRLTDVSRFPDVEGEGNYEYYVHTAKSRSPGLHEHMKVVAVDRINNTLTVERNAYRTAVWNNPPIENAILGWAVGTVIAYGPYRGFPDSAPDFVAWPYRVDRDRRLQHRETTVELFVAVEGDAEYTRIMSSDKYAWLFGDEDSGWLRYYYNPPGLNSIELSQYINDYVGSGAVAPPSGKHDVQYTQAILSREFIPAPRV